MESLSTKCDNAYVVTCNNRIAIKGDHQLLEICYKEAGALKHQSLIFYTLTPSSTMTNLSSARIRKRETLLGINALASTYVDSSPNQCY